MNLSFLVCPPTTCNNHADLRYKTRHIAVVCTAKASRDPPDADWVTAAWARET
jgi:hypothetical protein